MSLTIESWEFWKPDGIVEATLPDGSIFYTTADRDFFDGEFETSDHVIVGESFQLETETGYGPMPLEPMTHALEEELEDALGDFARDAS